MGRHFVDVVAVASDEVVRTLGPYESESLAERAERGLNMQINHESFYTNAREEKP